jgi:hypothetical protein
MARMIPTAPLPTTQSRAELRLFETFEQQLPNKYTVFHSVAWQLRDTRRGAVDGETDFLLGRPDAGLLVLEVKGGNVRYDGPTGQWYSGENPIADPFKQALKAKHSLLAKLKENPFWEKRWVTIGHAVAFPDVVVGGDLRLDAPRQLILDASDLGDVRTWARTALHHIQGADSTPLDAEAMAELEALLAPSWDLHPSLAAELEAQGQTIARLTEGQFAILDYLVHQRRVAISGCAGSGKTFVAVEKALRLDRQGFRTLLLCHNPNLAELLRKRVWDTGVQALDFGTWVSLVLSGEEQLSPGWTQYTEPTDDELTAAFDRLSGASDKFHAVIVDEGQDFRDEWWMVMEAALADDGILYIFHDDNQALLPLRSRYPIEQAPFVLSKNCRNTGAIFDLVRRFHAQAPETSLELVNRGTATLCPYDNTSKPPVEAALRDALAVLPPERIVLLTSEPEPADASALSRLEITIPNPLAWRDAVRSLLSDLVKAPRPVGLFGEHGRFTSSVSFPELSDSPYEPTREDIQGVAAFAKAIHGYPFSQRPRWEADIRTGELRLVSSTDTGSRARFRASLCSGSWAWDLPKTRTIRVRAHGLPLGPDEVRLDTTSGFKGLEADGIVLFVRPRDDLYAHLYVGISRARLLLHVVVDRGTLAQIPALSTKD